MSAARATSDGSLTNELRFLPMLGGCNPSGRLARIRFARFVRIKPRSISSPPDCGRKSRHAACAGLRQNYSLEAKPSGTVPFAKPSPNT